MVLINITAFTYLEAVHLYHCIIIPSLLLTANDRDEARGN